MFDVENQFDLQPTPARGKPVTKAPPKRGNLPPGCSECRGRPFVTVVKAGGSSGSQRCSCERGRALAAKDRERAGSTA